MRTKISRAGSKNLTAADVFNPQHTHAPPPCVFSPSASGVVCLLDQSLRPADVCSPPTRTHTHHPMWMCFRCSPSTSGVVLSSQFRRRQSLDRRELSLRRRRLRWIDCRRRTHFSHMAHPTFPISHIYACFKKNCAHMYQLTHGHTPIPPMHHRCICVCEKITHTKNAPCLSLPKCRNPHVCHMSKIRLFSSHSHPFSPICHTPILPTHTCHRDALFFPRGAPSGKASRRRTTI